MVQIPTDEEISWFIGVHEGDGCFTLNRNKYLRLQLRMIDQDTINKVHQIWGTGRIYIEPPKNERSKTKYQWVAVSQGDVLKICNLVFMHLTMVRQSQMASRLLQTNNHIPTSTPVRLNKLAWLAGILEAEGSFGCYKNTNRNTYQIKISIQMCDEPTLDYVSRLYQELFGIESRVLGPYYSKGYISKYTDHPNIKAENCKPFYQLQLQSKDNCITVASAVYPYMSERKKQCIDDQFKGVDLCLI